VAFTVLFLAPLSLWLVCIWTHPRNLCFKLIFWLSLCFCLIERFVTLVAEIRRSVSAPNRTIVQSEKTRLDDFSQPNMLVRPAKDMPSVVRGSGVD
jgi:hypothetical protein